MLTFTHFNHLLGILISQLPIAMCIWHLPLWYRAGCKGISEDASFLDTVA